MKNFLLSLMAIIMISSVAYANSSDRGLEIKKEVKKENIKADSFKIVESGDSEVSRKLCRMVVNYYYQGQFVSQQTYTTTMSADGSCGEWFNNMNHLIQHSVYDNGSVLPGGEYNG